MPYYIIDKELSSNVKNKELFDVNLKLFRYIYFGVIKLD